MGKGRQDLHFWSLLSVTLLFQHHCYCRPPPFLFLLNTKILLIVHFCHDDTSLSNLGNFVTHDAKKGWTCEQGKKLETTISLDIYCSLQVSSSGPGLEIIAGSRFAKRFEGRRRWGGGSGLRHVFPNSRGFVFPWDSQGIFCWFLRIPKFASHLQMVFLGVILEIPMKFVCETMGIPECRWLTFMERIWEMFGKIWCLVCRSISTFWGLGEKLKALPEMF